MAHMIMEYAGMTTVQAAYTFATLNRTAAILLPDVLEESTKLITTWNALRAPTTSATRIGEYDVAGLGEMFPYARALQLPGIHLLIVAEYPHIRYCAW
jgi:hypothetical protein